MEWSGAAAAYNIHPVAASPNEEHSALNRPQTTRLCVSIIRNDPPLEQQVVQAVAEGAELIELRVDRIEDIPAVERLLRRPHAVPYILTIRSAAEGGGWDGDEDERIALYERLGLLMPGFIDIELATLERSGNVRQKAGLVAELPVDSAAGGQSAAGDSRRSRNRLILSKHDFRRTPDDLAAVFESLARSGASIIKAAFAAADASDGLRILAELARIAPRRPTIAIGMGEGGVATRVLAKKFGAFLSYATVETAHASAPGQLTLRDMREVYRWPSIDSSTRVYGLVGWPTHHSHSPRVHNAAMARMGINAVYVPFPVKPGFEAFLRFMELVDDNPHLEMSGLSITIPHKENAYRWLKECGGECTGTAERCRAVNTLRRAGRSWQGDNTDAVALSAILSGAASQAGLLRGRPARVLVLGAGGMARAAAVAVAQAGLPMVLCNRTRERAESLAAEIGGEMIAWEQRGESAADLLIQCTSVGMWPDVNDSPMPEHALHSVACVIETIYNPPVTRLMRQAEQHGCETIGGAELFIRQAEAQFAYWHGAEPAAGFMRRVLVDASGRAGSGDE